MALTGAGMYLFAPNLMGIFTADTAVIALGAQVLRIEALAEPMFVASIVIGAIQLGATVDYAILMTTRSKTHKATFAPNKASMRPETKGERRARTTITGRMDASKRGKSASMHYEFSQKSNKSCYLLRRFLRNLPKR